MTTIALRDRTTEPVKRVPTEVSDDIQSRYQNALAQLNEATDEELVRALRIISAQQKLSGRRD